MTVIGNEHVTSALTEAVREDRLAGAYLLEGPAGSGKKTLAAFLTMLFVCSNVTEKGPCLTCANCKNVTVGAHPDVFYFEPEKDRESVSVHVVRRANEEACTAPIHASRRVFVVENAAQLNLAAQNALLKNLEEPQKSAVYLLLCEEAAGVLATIRSRSVIFRTQLLDYAQLMGELRRRYPKETQENLSLAARLCGGALGQALLFLKDRKMADCRKKVGEYIELVCKRAPFEAFCRLLNSDTKKDYLPLFYRVLLSAVRDLLCADVAEDRQFFALEQPLPSGADGRTLMALAERLCELTDPSMTSANVAASVYSLHAVASAQ